MRLLLLTCVLLAMACVTSSATHELRDRDWTLSSIEGVPALPAAAPPTIRFGSDGRVSASTGCNSAGANYTLTENRLAIEPLLMTKRACIEEERNQLETASVGAIEKTRSFHITADGTLELMNAGGAVVARFR